MSLCPGRVLLCTNCKRGFADKLCKDKIPRTKNSYSVGRKFSICAYNGRVANPDEGAKNLAALLFLRRYKRVSGVLILDRLTYLPRDRDDVVSRNQLFHARFMNHRYRQRYRHYLAKSF